MFKKGDVIQRVDESSWPEIHGRTGVDYTVSGYGEAISECGHKIDCRSSRYYRLIRSTSPVRTVTRKEIMPGKYGRINLTSGGAAGMVTIYTDGHVFSPTELRAAAATFIELADALEEGE